MFGEEVRIEEIPLGSPRMKAFAGFPWQLHNGDLCWTPPLRGELLGNPVLGMVGLLTRSHPYHRHADVAHFLAWRGKKPVGRVSAAINHRFNEHYGCKTGFFGFFDVVDDYEVARCLIDKARDWAWQRGASVLRGPGEYSTATHERQGVLVDGYEHPPTLELTHNPPYYPQFLERYGFAKAKDYYAYMVDQKNPASGDLGPAAAAIRRHGNIETRPLILKDLRSELRLVARIYNEGWSQNWGFLPLTDEEVDLMARTLRVVVDPGLVRFAFVHGEPAAVLGAFPDFNVALRPRWQWYGDSDPVRLARLFWSRRRISAVRLMFYGIRPDFRRLGISAILFDEVLGYGRRKGYRRCDFSMMLEDNHAIIRLCDLAGARRYKTWRIYDLPLK
jgi:GNAT superfamily N-acetyltransferase